MLKDVVKFNVEELIDIAMLMEDKRLTKEAVLHKIWEVANDLRQALKEDAQK